MVQRFSDDTKKFNHQLWGNMGIVPASSTPVPILIYGIHIKNVDHFEYLGMIISGDGSVDKKITCRIQKASQAIGSLRHRILNKPTILMSKKLSIHNAVVVSTLRYCSVVRH